MVIPDYEGMLEAVYRNALRPGDIVIDVGAHVGRHAVPMASVVGPTGRVLAFEPLPSAYARLKVAVQQAEASDEDLAPISTYELALGEEEGESEFVYVPDFPEYSGFKERLYHVDSLPRQKIRVRVKPLDRFLADVGNVRFIKVDAEGGELTILKGAAQTISRFSPIISFELGNASLVNYPYTAADYFDFISNFGYALYSIFGIPLSRCELVSAAETQFFWDYIAIPNNGAWPFGHAHIPVLLNQLAAVAGKEARRASIDGSRIVDLATQKGSAEAGANAAEARAQAAESQLKAIFASRSWRVTAPLRWIVGALRKM
jgi:FkbM family methyltransferase